MPEIIKPRNWYGDWVQNVTVHEEEVFTLSDLMALPEYSCSIPTGTTIGKRWRRATHYYSTDPAMMTEWWIGTYVEHPDEDRVGIEWIWAVSEPGVPIRTIR